MAESDAAARFPGRRFHTALNGRVSWYCVPEQAARATPPVAPLDAAILEAALIEWKHRGHRIDSNGYCDDCMRFVDLQAANDAREIVEAAARLSDSKGPNA